MLALPTALPAQDRTLDELIPESALDNPDGWATQAAPDGPEPESVEQARSEQDSSAGETLLPLETPTPETEYRQRSATDVELESFQLDLPEPLEPDPVVAALEAIDAPDLIDLPELDEVDLSGELALRFPKDRTVFPERDLFTDRFRALSAIVSLESAQDTRRQLVARARSDEALIDDVLRNYGYYDGQVIRQVARAGPQRNSEAQTPRARFDIIPGPRYSFGAIDLGQIDSAPDSEILRIAFLIQPGDPLYADRIVDQQLVLDQALGEMGYPFATIGEPSLEIDHARRAGDLTLPVIPKGKYVFASVNSSLPDFLPGEHLGRIARFGAGEVYQRSLVSDLRQAITATGLVSSVSITPREIAPPTDDRPGEVALDVELEPARLRSLAGAIGFGTEDGFKIEGSWEHRNLFPPEGSLKLRGILGTREQLASVGFKRNNFKLRDQVLTIDAYFSDITTESVDARTFALRGTVERVSNLLFQKPFSWALGAEALHTDERNRVIAGIERPRQNYVIGSLFGRATLDGSNDLLDPTRGFRLTGFVAPEYSRTQGANAVYLRAQADATYYRPVGQTVIASRVRLATIQGAETFQIAPSRRLYAGGGGSVRGYGFQAVSPRNDLGEPTGGRSLAEFSLEARIPTELFDGALQVVPFFDLGAVSIDPVPDFRFVQYGAGVGIRYKTGFGPVRVDVGVPLNPTQFDSPIAVYVSLGQAF